MNVEIGAEAALFPEKEYIKGIFVAVHSASLSILRCRYITVNFVTVASQNGVYITQQMCCIMIRFCNCSLLKDKRNKKSNIFIIYWIIVFLCRESLHVLNPF
jgi:hypothetical protein